MATVVQYSAVRSSLLLLVLAGCGASMVIPRDDATYRRAIAHYQRTRQLVAASLAPDEDQAMFLQAEALFRYRFESGRRSTGAVFAELAASATDLPMLESVAGSLDLYALRLQVSDGAIQLWETLLDRSPNRHVGFGLGPHRCLGIHLARRELRIALQAFHRRLPDYRPHPAKPAELFGGMKGVSSLWLQRSR